VAVNEPKPAPEGIVIEGGVVTRAELLAIVMSVPVNGAAAESVTVQFALPAAVNDPGRQTSEVKAGPRLGTTIVNETLCEDCVPVRVAVRVPV
jgi:hypothetical protein